MRATLSILLVLAVTATTASAGVLPVHYQHDAGQEGDASDACDKLNVFIERGMQVGGLLVPVDDPVDYYGTYLQPGAVILFGQGGPHLSADGTTPGGPSAPAGPLFRVLTADCRGVLAISTNSGNGYQVAEFTVERPGLYVVEVTMNVSISPGGAIGLPGGGVPKECHWFCDDLLGVGYEFGMV